MIAEDLQPLSIVENSGFRHMIELLDSRYEIPSRRALSKTIIPDIFSSVKNKVKVLLNEASHVAITTDIWTSMNTDSFITLTAHFFDKNQLGLKTVVLCTKKLESNHTGIYLSEIMIQELKDWDILTKVVAIVTDGGANIKLAVRLMHIMHIPCAAHKLNLIVQQALQLLDGEVGEQDNVLKIILKKCRSIVGFFKRSEAGSRMLANKQKQLGIGQVLKVKQDICTRWNSTLFMLERLVKLKEPLAITIISINEAPENLNPDEWVIIEDLIPLLKPFDNLTVELSAEKYPTIAKVIPLIRGLQGSLILKNPSTIIGKRLKTNLMENIIKRFDGIEKQTLTPFYSRATLLNPRFKKIAFGVEENANETERYIVAEIADSLCTSNTEQVTVREKIEEQDNVWNFLKSRVSSIQSQGNATSNANNLMRQYLSMPHQELNCNIPLYWNQHKSVLYPISDIAMKYAIIPATSVPSERIFSKAGQIMSARCNRLLPENLNILIFLNKNM